MYDVHPQCMYQIKSQSETSERWAIWKKVLGRNRNESRYFWSGIILLRMVERSQICLNRWTLIYFIFLAPENIHKSRYNKVCNQNKCLPLKQAIKMENEWRHTALIQSAVITLHKGDSETSRIKSRLKCYKLKKAVRVGIRRK